MQQKFKIGFCTFSYGGNGGISSEVPDIREWMIPAVSSLSQDSRVSAVQVWNLSDTPITMTRNRAVLMARQYGVDVLVMVDSDMKPDLYANQLDAKPFVDSSFDFLVKHYHKGPVVIGAPYCGPPPHENVYVFRWQAHQSENANPDFKLEMYDRDTAAKLGGIQECAALPTGLIMYDMRAFDVTEPQANDDKPWFYYEYSDKFQAEKASTEDVTMTRDLSLAGTQKLGYNPVFCNWDAWAGHWKPKCVGKPQIIQAIDVSAKLKQCWTANYDAAVKTMTVTPSPLLRAAIDKATTSIDAMEQYVALSDGTREKLTALWTLMDASPHGVFCEVGNREGGTLLMAMHHPRSTHVIGIDPYGGLPYTLPGGGVTDQYDDAMYGRMQRLVSASPVFAKLSHYKLTSEDWIRLHGGGKYAFVYLDGRHDKQTVDMEIDFFSKHMADGGIICIDDVSMIPDVDLTGYGLILDMAYKRFSG